MQRWIGHVGQDGIRHPEDDEADSGHQPGPQGMGRQRGDKHPERNDRQPKEGKP